MYRKFIEVLMVCLGDMGGLSVYLWESVQVKCGRCTTQNIMSSSKQQIRCTRNNLDRS